MYVPVISMSENAMLFSSIGYSCQGASCRIRPARLGCSDLRSFIQTDPEEWIVSSSYVCWSPHSASTSVAVLWVTEFIQMAAPGVLVRLHLFFMPECRFPFYRLKADTSITHGGYVGNHRVCSYPDFSVRSRNLCTTIHACNCGQHKKISKIPLGGLTPEARLYLPPVFP